MEALNQKMAIVANKEPFIKPLDSKDMGSGEYSLLGLIL